ncbi:MAG: hypothetical protein K9L17_13510 [Clostridiales bacterium]|nr:hypothetical protein [Clostridiales bacterium]MCF8023691.1 hypothetical protein [Clostridiales bacterium]
MNELNLKFGFRDNFLEGVRQPEELEQFVKTCGQQAEIDAQNLRHKEINDLIRDTAKRQIKHIILRNVCGHRYIGTRLSNSEGETVKIDVYNYAGNDLGVFLDGHHINVYGNAQDGVGNTMNSGEIVVHGKAADVAAMSMRGGKVFIRDNVGYRAAIHMKEYKDKVPVLVIGGTAQDFFGEYMAGGKVILLGLNLKEGEMHRANYIGTGMHGGVIYLRGNVKDSQLGKEVGIRPLDEEDKEIVEKYVKEYCSHFNCDPGEILNSEFKKLLPVSSRPYGKIYAY